MPFFEIAFQNIFYNLLKRNHDENNYRWTRIGISLSEYIYIVFYLYINSAHYRYHDNIIQSNLRVKKCPSGKDI